MFDMKEIGKRISVLRKQKGMTQMELANKFGISFQAVSNWERGISMPDISNLTDLADALDSTIDYILGDEKTADVIADLKSGRIPEKKITPEEFNNIAPLLPSDKNDLLINYVNNEFTEEEAEIARPNLGFGGEYGSSDDELALKAFERNQIAIFSVLLNGISDSCAVDIFKKAQVNNSIPFIAMLLKRVPDEEKRLLALKAFEDNNIAVFCIVKRYLTDKDTEQCKKRAFENSNIAFFAVLSSKKKSSDKTQHAEDRGYGEKYRQLKNEYQYKKKEYYEAKTEYRRMKRENADEDLLDIQEEKIDRLEDEMDELEDMIEDLEDTMDDDD